jgi:hypothetical protein
MISLSMLILSMWTFYSHRDLNNEYFNRQLIYQKLLNNPDENALQFNEISTVDDLQNFLQTTVATQIFEPQQARLEPEDEGFNEEYISTYIFQ